MAVWYINSLVQQSAQQIYLRVESHLTSEELPDNQGDTRSCAS